MGKKLKRNDKKKSKILKTIDKLKNKITAKEKKLSKVTRVYFREGVVPRRTTRSG